MRIVRATDATINEAVQIVKEGGLVVYPTDTVYGLGCDPFNVNAVKRVMKVKGRSKKPLPVLVASLEEAGEIAHITDEAYRLANKLWPGALTMILRKKPALSNVVTCGLNSVGIRSPNHATALKLIQLSGGFLIGTSANLTGKKSPRTAEEAAKQVGKHVDLILDAGASPIGIDSTIIDLASRSPRIVRPGPVGAREIAEALGIEESRIC